MPGQTFGQCAIDRLNHFESGGLQTSGDHVQIVRIIVGNPEGTLRTTWQALFDDLEGRTCVGLWPGIIRLRTFIFIFVEHHTATVFPGIDRQNGTNGK